MEKMLNVKFTIEKVNNLYKIAKKLNTMPRPSVCIKVPKNQGEKTITLATKLGLADKSLVIQREEDSLCIPLVREPQGIELTTLKSQIPKFNLYNRCFQ